MRLAGRLAPWVPRGSLPAVAARMANPLLAFAAGVLIARLLGPAAFGDYSLAATTLGVLLLAALLGLDTLTPRTLAVQLGAGDAAGAARYLRWSTRTTLAASVALAAASAGVVLWNPMAWGPGARHATWVLLAALPFAAWLRLARSRLQAVERTATGLAFEMPVWTLLLLAGAAVLWAVPSWRGAPGMAAAHGAALALAWAGAAVAFRRHVPRPRPPAQETARPPWLAAGLLLGAFGVLTYLMAGAGVLVVGTVLPAEATGRYSVALRAAALALVVVQPLQMVVAPRLARAWAEGRRADVEAIAGQCLRLSLVAGLLAAAGMWALGPLLLSAYGPGYGAAVWALRWLAVAQVVLAAAGPLGLVLRMVHEERAAVTFLAALLLVAVPATILAARAAGIEGAALANLGTAAAMLVGFDVLLARRTGLRVRPWGAANARAPQAS